ncbi:MAG: hypothetical protein Q9201_004046 [Fulgogasparrea decipioides]
MKVAFFSAVSVTLLHLIASQPHRMLLFPREQNETLNRRVGSHHQHLKRQPNVKTEISYVTLDAQDVVVYVDGKGNPVSTTTVYHNQPPPTASPSPPPPPPPEPQPQPNPAPAPDQQPQSHQGPSAPQQPQNPPNAGDPVTSGPGFKSGVSYSPYNADNTCKSTQQVATDLAQITGYQVIRLYGTDCNQVANVLAATEGSNVKLFLGIFDLAQVQKESETIATAVKGDWSRVSAISVGNELVNKGTDPGTVIGAVEQARGALKSSGYNGPVVTVDTMTAMANHPEICKASDFCAINCHAFFDGKTPAENSGEFVKGWVDKIGQATGKTVVVTETGWPTQGDTNGVAVPSQDNHLAALQSIKGALSTNVIFYSAYNDMWKKNWPGSFNAEQFWGLNGNAPSS